MYEKLPWELGYPMYEEFDVLMPFITHEVFKRRQEEKGNTQANRDFNALRNEMYKSDKLGSN